MEKENNSMLGFIQDGFNNILDELRAMRKEIHIIKEQQKKQNEHLLRLQNPIISQITNKMFAKTSVNDLPTEIWLEIFKFLPHKDRKQVRPMCKHFQQLINSITNTTLKIEPENVAEIRARIETQNIGGLNFKRVRLLWLESVEDIKFILQSIGKQIDDLSIYGTEIWENFSRLVPNLKSFELFFRGGLESYSYLDQCEWPLLEKLNLLNNRLLPSETNLLLTKISEENSTIVLKELQLECYPRCENSVENVLRRHANSLEILNIYFYEPCRIGCNLTFSKMFKLKELHLKGSLDHEFLRTIFNVISKLSALEVIEINCCGYDLLDPITWDLRELKNLRELRLFNCPLPNAHLIGQIPLMEILEFDTEKKIKEMDLIRFISCFPNLRTLILNMHATAMSNKILLNIFRHQNRLQSITIYDCHNITDAGLIGTKDDPYPISRLKYLEILHLYQFVNLTDQALSEFHFPNLRILDLGQSKEITSKGIEKLVTNCPRLEDLTISNDTADNDNALFSIRNGLKHLKKLTIKYCHGKDYRDIFNSLKDPLTNEPFASKCELICF